MKIEISNFVRVDNNTYKYGDYLFKDNGVVISERNGKELKQEKGKNTPRVTLSQGGKTQRINVAETIAELFLEKENDNLVVGFKDRDKNNVALENLEWITPEEAESRMIDKVINSLKKKEEEFERINGYKEKPSQPKEIDKNDFKYVDKHTRDFFGYLIKDNGEVIGKNKCVMSPMTAHNGYKRLTLNIDGKSQKYAIHRLVAFAFIDNENEERKWINHIDGNKGNNDISNLEWCTQSENMKHAVKLNDGKNWHFGFVDENNLGQYAAIKCEYKGKIYQSTTQLWKELGFTYGNNPIFMKMFETGEIKRLTPQVGHRVTNKELKK